MQYYWKHHDFIMHIKSNKHIKATGKNKVPFKHVASKSNDVSKIEETIDLFFSLYLSIVNSDHLIDLCKNLLGKNLLGLLEEKDLLETDNNSIITDVNNSVSKIKVRDSYFNNNKTYLPFIVTSYIAFLSKKSIKNLEFKISYFRNI